MEFVGVHWTPNKRGCSGTFTESYQEEDDHVSMSSPPPISRRTLVIWVRRGCMACQLNRRFFATLESTAKDMRVVRVEASDRMQKQFKHITTLPLYDIVEPDVSGSSDYGPQTRLIQTIRNDRREDLNKYIQVSGSG